MRSIIKRESAYKTNYERAPDQLLDGSLVMKLCYRVLHNPNSTDSFRCASYKSTREILGDFAEWIDTEQIFPSSEEELMQKVNQYESKLLDGLPQFGVMPNCSLVEAREKFLSRVAEIVGPVKNFYTGRTKFGWFAAHLNGIISLFEFLESDYEAVILCEDDIQLPPDFLDEITKIDSVLDFESVDFFNFVVPEEQKSTYVNYLDVGDSHISQSYQGWPGAALLVTRSGVTKYLHTFLFSSTGTINDARGGDEIIHNVTLTIRDDHSYQYNLDFSASRYMKTFTYKPHYGTTVKWRADAKFTTIQC